MEPGETAAGARARELAVARLELKAAAAQCARAGGQGSGGAPTAPIAGGAAAEGGGGRPAGPGEFEGRSLYAGNGRWLKTDAPLVVLDLEGRRLAGDYPHPSPSPNYANPKPKPKPDPNPTTTLT